MPDPNKIAKRPARVTIVAWFFMLWALLSVAPKLYLVTNAEAYETARELSLSMARAGAWQIPVWLQLTHAFLGVPILVVSTIFMLKGRVWALAVFGSWLLGVLVLTFAVSGLSFSLYAKLTVTAVVAVVLATPRSLSYFTSRAR